MFGSRNHGEMTKSEGKIKHQLELLGFLTAYRARWMTVGLPFLFYIYLEINDRSIFDTFSRDFQDVSTVVPVFSTMKRVRKPSEKIVGASEIRVPQTNHQKYHQKRSRPTVDKERQEAAAAADALKQALKEQVNKTVSAPSVTFAVKDKATELILSDDLMNCKGVEGGFRMARATHGVHRGEYYWECHILPSKDPNAHVRIGWSTEKGELQAPVGYDKFSFAYRDIEGSKVHNSQRVDHYGESFGRGDVIGCYLYITNHTEAGEEEGQSQPTRQNEIRFFKNGKDQGVAFSGEQIPSGAGWVRHTFTTQSMHLPSPSSLCMYLLPTLSCIVSYSYRYITLLFLCTCKLKSV